MKILFIDACVSIHPESRTRYLCDQYLRQVESNGETVERIELESLSIAPLSKATLSKREKLIQKRQYQDDMFTLARQFKSADKIVIGAPYWDFSFPSILKVYIEHIMVSGLTFRYTEKGAEGLCTAASLTYITTVGGYIGNKNLGYEYVKAVAELLGIKKTDFVFAEGLDIDGADVTQILNEARSSLWECHTIPYPKSYQDE